MQAQPRRLSELQTLLLDEPLWTSIAERNQAVQYPTPKPQKCLQLPFQGLMYTLLCDCLQNWHTMACKSMQLSWLAVWLLEVAKTDFVLGKPELAVLLTEPAIIRV